MNRGGAFPRDEAYCICLCVCLRVSGERGAQRKRDCVCAYGRAAKRESESQEDSLVWTHPKSHRLANRVVNLLPPNTGIVEGSVSNGPGRPGHFYTSLRPAGQASQAGPGQAYSYFRAKKWTCGLTRRTNYSALVFVYTRRPPASRCASFYILCSVLLHFFLLLYLLFVPK